MEFEKPPPNGCLTSPGLDAAQRDEELAPFVRSTPCLRPDQSIWEAERMLAEDRGTALPVVDRDQRLLGTLSHADIDRMRSDPASAQETGEFITDVDDYSDLEEEPSSAHGTRVGDVMDPKPRSVTVGTPVRDVASLMNVAGIHTIPVTAAGRVLGIVSALDLLDIVATGDDESG